MDNHRTDIKAASSHQGGTRLISEEDLASLGMGNHPETRTYIADTESSSSSKKEGMGSLLRFFGWLAFVTALALVLHNVGNGSLSSSSSSEGAKSFSGDGLRRERLNSANSPYIASAGEFQFQPSYEKAISLIPGFAVDDKKTYLGTVEPKDLVATLGKASSGEATYIDSSSTPYLLSFDYQSDDASGDILLEKMGAYYKLALLSLKHLKSDRFANKNGSLTKDDFTNIKVGMPYLELLNTVGIPDQVQLSQITSYNESPTFTYRLSDSQTVQIHFDSRKTIKDITSKEGATPPASSSTPTAQ